MNLQLPETVVDLTRQGFVRRNMAMPPSPIFTQETPDAGTGLFASSAIPPGVEILRIDTPLVSVLDSPRLKDTCSECNLWLPENGHDRGSQGKRLKTCHGCQITRYCCKVGPFLLKIYLKKRLLLLLLLLLLLPSSFLSAGLRPS